MKFIKNPEKFIRSPLGILGLFIFMNYSFFTVFFVSSKPSLIESQTWFMIFFLILFPFVNLYVFYVLVTKYSDKIFGPGDFKNDENFLKFIFSIGNYNSDVVNKKKQNNDKEIQEQLEKLQSDKMDSKSIVNSNYLIAEDLSLKKIEKNLKKYVQRYVPVNIYGQEFIFDGLIDSKNELICIEVKYLNSQKPSLSMAVSIRRMLVHLSGVSNDFKTMFNKKLSFKLIIVCGFPKRLDAKSQIIKWFSEKLSGIDLKYDITIFYLDDLKKNLL